jgi:OmpA-OmpF porin, OOP family
MRGLRTPTSDVRKSFKALRIGLTSPAVRTVCRYLAPQLLARRIFSTASGLISLLAAVIALCALPRTAGAQQKYFYLDRAQLSGAPDDGFMVWRPQMHDRTRFYGFAALGYSQRPLRAGTVANSSTVADKIESPVRGQFITYLIAGTEIAKRVGFNLALPVLAYQFNGADPIEQDVGGGGIGDNKVALHDLRLDARVRIYESDNRRLRFGAGGALFLPTGNGQAFASDDNATTWLYGSGELDFEKFLIAGMLGPHFRSERSIGGGNGDLFIGSEMRWAFGAYLPLRDGRVRLGGELWGTTGIQDVACPNCRTSVFASKNTDLEWLAQARFTHGEKQRVYWMVGGGTRLSGGYGAPDFRLLASIGTYFTLTDFQGKAPARKMKIVPDVADYAKDTDQDGYPDDIDQCPTVKEDGKPPDPSDGCPAGSDRDGDGIPDIDDACPDKPEDKDGIQDEDGCPETDADNDQIPDTEDKCPTEPGPRSKIAEKNGCPSLTRVTEEGTVELLRPIEFEFGKATIKPVSFEILDEVVTLMKARKEIRMGIYGHTDNVGADARNLDLSKQRAASVVRYITSKGIAQNRLESEGFGETKPIATNGTDEGRARNRRVEFKILEE